MPEIARGNQTDTVSTGHGCDSTTTTDTCSAKVFVNGIGVVREGDTNTVHTVPSGAVCVPHTVALSTFSSKVFVEGLGIGRKGDGYGSEVITSGSAQAYAG